MARNITESFAQTLRYEWEWIVASNPFPEYPKVGLNRSPKISENLLAILLQQGSLADSIYREKRTLKKLILNLSRYNDVSKYTSHTKRLLQTNLR